MADVKAVLLNDGKRLITGALAGFTGIAPVKFRVGDMAGFTPDVNDVDIRGQLVFEGLSGLMQARRLADDTVRYTLVITESYGPFYVGNIVMFAAHADNAPEALVSVVLPFKVKKTVSNPDIGALQPFPVPGSRLTINITIKHSIDGDDIVVQVVNPEFSSLPFFDLQTEVPPPAINPWSQFVIHNDTRLDTPTLITKRSDGTQWGIPFWQNFRSPKFGVIDGGTTGDNHKPNAGSFLWGYFYLTPNEYLKSIIGQSGYIQSELNYVGQVGGISY